MGQAARAAWWEREQRVTVRWDSCVTTAHAAVWVHVAAPAQSPVIGLGHPPLRKCPLLWTAVPQLKAADGGTRVVEPHAVSCFPVYNISCGGESTIAQLVRLDRLVNP